MSKDSQLKTIVFPLNKDEVKEVTVEELRKRNPHEVGTNLIFKDMRNHVWDPSMRDGVNKSNRLSRAWRSRAADYEMCLFCFGETVTYQDESKFNFINCKKCSNEIWHSLCLNCSVYIEDNDFIFCCNCLSLIDDKALKAKFDSFIKENNIQKVNRELRIVEPQRCSLCEEIVNPYLGIFCPKHMVLSRNFDRYKRQLILESKCTHCEKELPKKVKEANLNNYQCNNCSEKFEKNLTSCASCGQLMGRFFDGVIMEVRFEVCMDCVVKRANIVAQWKTSESAGERALFKVLCKIFREENIYRYVHPVWLDGLELDFYIPNEKIAFEYDGKQHFEYISHFHRNEEDFLAQKQRDLRKNELCKENMIKLIRIQYDFDISTENIQTIIVSKTT